MKVPENSRGLRSGPMPKAPDAPQDGFEESLKLKRKILAFILAVIPAALMPLAATGQVAPEAAPGPAERPQPTYKYQVFAGYAYTSLNQVNQSRHGLQGVKVGLSRDWGRFFGLVVNGDYYKYPLGSGNPGDPSVYSAMAGPEVRANIYDKIGGFVHGLLGVEHTGGEEMTPNLSFAGGAGGGLTYNLGRRLILFAYGDKIGASFSVTGNNPSLGYSPHRTWNAHATFGVAYKF
jgi:hypothetical protein